MKTLEALISLVVLLSIIATIDLRPQTIDSSLYQYQLASDLWRVLQLKGATHDPTSAAITINELQTKMGLCIIAEGLALEKCEISADADMITIERTAYVDGDPIAVRLRMGLPNNYK